MFQQDSIALNQKLKINLKVSMMSIDELKAAWKQEKLLNAIPSLDSNEILDIIDQPLGKNKKMSLRKAVSFALLIFLMAFIQGG